MGEVRPPTDTTEPTTPLAVPTTRAGQAHVAFWLAGRTHPPSTQRLGEFIEHVRATEAEARDATGLREALVAALSVALHDHLDPGCTGSPDYFVTQRMAERVMQTPVVDAALAAAPSEPRWPSVETLTLAINAVSPISDDPQDPMTEDERAMIGMAREEFARRILGALREGGERR